MFIISTFPFLLSLTATLLATPLIRRLALAASPLNKVKIDIKQGKRIPHLGGLGVFVSFLIVLALMSLRQGFFTAQLKAVIVGASIIFIVGLLDDFIELSPAAKFSGQVVAVTVLVACGVTTKIALIGPLLNIVVTFVWTLSIINALNLLDIMDGLCSGITVIAAAAFLMIAFISQNLVAIVLSSFVIGAGLGFLRYNFPPAKIYLGDNGSMFFGFILAATAIIIDYAPLKREIALLVPILILGLPLFDTAFVVLMRIVHGRPIMKKSKDHFALRLLSAGWKDYSVILAMYLFGLFFAGSALLINRVSNIEGLILLIMIAVICTVALKKIGAIKIDG